jgi:hypothetical protein
VSYDETAVEPPQEGLTMSTAIAEVLTDLDLETIRRLIREAHRRATRAEERNREKGIEPTGALDANRVRQKHMALLMQKIEAIQEDNVPESFLTPRPQDLRHLDVSDNDAARVAREERDAAEALADQRGVLLARTLPMLEALATPEDDDMWGQINGDAAALEAELREHLRVTGEVADAERA